MIQNNEEARHVAQEQELIASEEFKLLPSEELLSIWEHTQLVESEVRTRFGASVAMIPNYEKIIISELHQRLLNSALDIKLTVQTRKKAAQKPRLKRRCPRPIHSRG